MRNKPWTMKEGFIIGAGLIVIGLILQCSVGSVVWDTFSWPINIIVLVALLVMIIWSHLLRKRVYVIRFLSSYQAAIPALVYTVALTMVMGLTRQTSDGSWLSDMLSFWSFVLVYVYVAVILGFVILRRLGKMRKQVSIHDLSFLLNHLGLFVAMTTATLGNADMQRVRMMTVIGEPEWRAVTLEGKIQELPLTIELKKFLMETYDDGSPKRFASEVSIQTKKGKSIQTTIDVNKPVEVDGWKIYQYGYDTQMGTKSNMSILELVSDPWLPYVYIGIYMMLAGAVCMFVIGGKKQ